MSVTLTERAALEVKKAKEANKYGDETFVRVGISAGGCSGFSYRLAFDSNFDETMDSRSEQHGVSVVVDKKSALLMDGAVVDYYEDLERRGFKFENPNAVKTCGCGSSFQA